MELVNVRETGVPHIFESVWSSDCDYDLTYVELSVPPIWT